MIEIIALIFILRSVGATAKQKGLSVSRWRWYTIAAWFGFEIPGLLIGYMINHNLYMANLLALGFAFGGYLLVKYKLDQISDSKDEHWMDRIGRQDR
jgi:hypothetical protein